MKITLLLIVCAFLSLIIEAQNKFLPSPTASLQTVPAGSYVIAMDNNLQSNASGYFNLKTYGLITHLLNNQVKLKWVIRSGKVKDGIDFSGLATQLLPTPSLASLRDFKSGPFVIYAADTTGVTALVNSFNTTNGLTGNNRPKIYSLTLAVNNVDIRHDMAGFRPKVAILADGNKTEIHLAYMSICGIPTSNYTTGLGGMDLLTRCFTFASEPHNSSSSSTTIAAIKKFVEYGGNFLAQCAAVETYENNPSGRFQTSSGLQVINSTVSTASTIYPNADLTYTQFEGVFDISNNGSVRNWTLAAGSSFTNNGHHHCSSTTGIVGASVSKLTSSALSGGMVFYLGNHSFSSTSSITEINGMRMYMNAMLTPNAININCNTGNPLPAPLGVKLTAFNAILNNDNKSANLNWTSATEINASHYVVEKSIDGINYFQIGNVTAKGNSSDQTNYTYIDNLLNNSTSLIYYRLRQVDLDFKNTLSSIRTVRINTKMNSGNLISCFPNPAKNQLAITLPSKWQNKRVTYKLFSVNGQPLKNLEISSSSQIETLDISNLPAGLYLVSVICEGQIEQQKIFKN